MATESIRCTYRVRCTAERIEDFAHYLAVEQTVECPQALISEEIEARLVGRVRAIEPDGDCFRVVIAYAPELAQGQLPQLLNLIYGIIAMLDWVRLVDLELPEVLLGRFAGPRYGSQGVRQLTGVSGRPLLCTAIKPRGAPIRRMVEIVREFALGGGDLVKDDHNLVDASPAAFRERVARLAEAVQNANRSTGRHCLYLPNLCAPVDQLDGCCDGLIELGIEGVMVAPMLLGLDRVRQLAARHSLLVMAHPSFAGALVSHEEHGIAPEILLGTLFRLAGADCSVFTGLAGRYPTSPEVCAAIARRLCEPLGSIPPAMPGPAGGMRLDLFKQMVELYGSEALFVVAGALLTRPDLRAATARHIEVLNDLCR